MTGQIRVLLADDHALVRQMLGERLAREPDIEVVDMRESADNLAAEAASLKPDVVVLDIDMPGASCFDVAQGLRKSCPEARVLFLSAFCHDAYVAQALAVGASGYLTKGEPPQVLIEALRAVAAGQTRFSAEVQSRMVVVDGGVALTAPKQSRAATLTTRELEVLRHLARGLSRKETARIMHLSAHTIESHTTRLMRRLDIHNRAELCRFAIREGLIQP